MELKERIIKAAEELFFKFGIRSVSMDDIASKLGISKKTIYLHFEDKDAIINEVARIAMECDIIDSQRIFKESENAIDAVYKETELFLKNKALVNPTLIYDLKKYHPKTWELFREHKNGIFLEMVKKNLRTGIEEGLYRSEINVEILAILRMEEIELGFDNNLFSPTKFSQLEIHLTFIDHFLRGILTERGLNVYQSYKKLNH